MKRKRLRKKQWSCYAPTDARPIETRSNEPSMSDFSTKNTGWFRNGQQQIPESANSGSHEMTITDSERIDWMLLHSDAEFGGHEHRRHVRFWSNGPVSGYYVAKGVTDRECIDAAIAGQATPI